MRGVLDPHGDRVVWLPSVQVTGALSLVETELGLDGQRIEFLPCSVC